MAPMRVFVALVLLLLCCGGVAYAGYDTNLALRAVYYCAASYCSPSSVSSWTCGTPCSTLPGVSTGASVLSFSQTTSTQATFGFVAYNANYNEIVVTFRGTDGLYLNSESFANWVTNLSVEQVPYSMTTSSGDQIMVHEGFYTAYQGVQNQVLSELQNAMNNNPSANVVITGHSLGGALASFAAMDIATQIAPSSSVEFSFYTFGCPRMGDANWAQLFEETFPAGSSWRVVHYYDLVPHVPMEIQGYSHVEPMVWYNEASSSYQISQTAIPSYGDSIADHVDYLNVQLTSICATPYGDQDNVLVATLPQKSPSKNTSNVGIIVGTVCGGVGLIALVAVLAVVVVRRRRRGAAAASTSGNVKAEYRNMSSDALAPSTVGLMSASDVELQE